jgi:branched-chain amino acid transport system substrate-binding protein
MRKVLIASLFALLVSPAAAQTVKIGLIMPYSGQFADTATQMDNAIKLYVKQHGDTVAGRKIEFIRKDTGGIAPDVAKRLAQELVVRDKVDILAGLILTPNALAVGDISAEAKKLAVIMNAATSIITTKSPYMTRTSVTTPMLNQTLGTWAATKGGVKKVFTMVSDYGPGHDAEGAFHLGFKEAGGEVVGSVRFPVANPDFSAFVQRAKDSGAEAIYIWIPGGAQPPAMAKAMQERNFPASKILGQGEITMDDNALKKTKGDASGEKLIAAAKGMKWESPRGPISIDPETRDIVQDIYIRRVEKVGGQVQNVEFDTIKAVKDPAHGAK